MKYYATVAVFSTFLFVPSLAGAQTAPTITIDGCPATGSCALTINTQNPVISGHASAGVGSVIVSVTAASGGYFSASFISGVNSGVWSGVVGGLSNNGVYIVRAAQLSGTAYTFATVTVQVSGASGGDGDDTGGDTPTPTLTLAANDTSITGSDTLTLSWSSTNATSCAASGAWSGAKALQGSGPITFSAVTTTVTRSYILTCVGSGGTVTRSVNVSFQASTDTTTDPSATFTVGDRVRVTETMHVRSGPAGTDLGTVSPGVMGTILGGGQSAALNGYSYTWWNINYDSGPDGWSIENFLTKVSTAVVTTPTASIDTASYPTTTNGILVTLSGSSANVPITAGDSVPRLSVDYAPTSNLALVQTNTDVLSINNRWSTTFFPVQPGTYRVRVYDVWPTILAEATLTVTASTVSVASVSGTVTVVPPTITLGNATLSTSGTTLNATVSSGGAPTSAWFYYGQPLAGFATPTTCQEFTSSLAATQTAIMAQQITSFTANASNAPLTRQLSGSYPAGSYYCAMAMSSAGTVYSDLKPLTSIAPTTIIAVPGGLPSPTISVGTPSVDATYTIGSPFFNVTWIAGNVPASVSVICAYLKNVSTGSEFKLPGPGTSNCLRAENGNRTYQSNLISTASNPLLPGQYRVVVRIKPTTTSTSAYAEDTSDGIVTMREPDSSFCASTVSTPCISGVSQQFSTIAPSPWLNWIVAGFNFGTYGTPTNVSLRIGATTRTAVASNITASNQTSSHLSFKPSDFSITRSGTYSVQITHPTRGVTNVFNWAPAFYEPAPGTGPAADGPSCVPGSVSGTHDFYNDGEFVESCQEPPNGGISCQAQFGGCAGDGYVWINNDRVQWEGNTSGYCYASSACDAGYECRNNRCQTSLATGTTAGNAVSVTNPAPSSSGALTVTSNTPTISGTASGVSKVLVILDATGALFKVKSDILTVSAQGTWSAATFYQMLYPYPMSIPNGAYLLKIYDMSGTTIIPATPLRTYTLTVANQGVSNTITSLVNGASNTPTISGIIMGGIPSVYVTIFNSSGALVTTTNTAQVSSGGAWSVTAPTLANGTYTFYVRSTSFPDPIGPYTLVVGPPTTSSLNVSCTGTVNGTSITWTANVTPAGTYTYNWYRATTFWDYPTGTTRSVTKVYPSTESGLTQEAAVIVTSTTGQSGNAFCRARIGTITPTSVNAVISSISPSTIYQGTQVTLSGSGFPSAGVVLLYDQFGRSASTTFTSANGTSATFTANLVPHTYNFSLTDAGRTWYSNAKQITVAGLPTVATGQLSGVLLTTSNMNASAGTATILGRVNPNGSVGESWFMYRRAPAPGTYPPTGNCNDLESYFSSANGGVKTPDVAYTTGTSNINVSANVSGLTAGTYHFCAYAENSAGQRGTGSNLAGFTFPSVSGASENSTAFSVDDRVQVNDSGVQVRNSAAGGSPVTVPIGTVGTIKGGGQSATLNGISYYWWEVEYGVGLTGWTAQNFLTGITITRATYTSVTGRAVNTPHVKFGIYPTPTSDTPTLATIRAVTDGNWGYSGFGPMTGYAKVFPCTSLTDNSSCSAAALDTQALVAQ